MSPKADELAELVNKRFPGALRKASDPSLEIVRLPTGMLALDTALNGGIARGRYTELYGGFCPVLESRILTTGLDWVEAGELAVGDELIGFDSQLNQGRGRSSIMAPSRVTRYGECQLECLRVITDKGEITVSEEHPFVAFDPSQGRREWIQARKLTPGRKMVWFGEPWRRIETYDAGYLAGLFDGEGWVTKANGDRGTSVDCGFAQNPGLVADRGLAILKEQGFEISIQPGRLGNRCLTYKVLGGKYGVMRFLGQIRPERLLRKDVWEGSNMVSRGRHTHPGNGWATVERVERVGSRDVAMIETETQTYLSDGFLSHNSVGKTYTTHKLIATSQAAGLRCSFANVEGSFDPVFARHVGVDLDQLDMPDCHSNANRMFDVVEALLRSDEFAVVVIDSIASLLPKSEEESELSAGSYGTSQARLMSTALRKLTPANGSTAVVFLNQIRENIGVTFGKRTTTPGGLAMGHYAGDRIEFVRTETIKRLKRVVNHNTGEVSKVEKACGHRVLVRIEKSKTGIQPLTETTFVYNYDIGGVDPIEDLLYLGRVTGLVHKKANSWWVDEYEEEKANGRKAFARWLRTNVAVAQELEEKIREASRHEQLEEAE